MCSNRCANPVRPGTLVQRPNVIPEVHRNQRQTMVFMRDHLQAVGQRVSLVLDFRQLQCAANTGLM